MKSAYETNLDPFETYDVIAICPYHWTGVMSATTNMIPDYILTKQMDDANICIEDMLLHCRQIGKLLKSVGCTRILMGGFPASYELLVEILVGDFEISVYPVWHGNVMQYLSPGISKLFQSMLDLFNDGYFQSIGFAKDSMAKLYAELGYDTSYIPNYHRKIPDHNFSKSSDDGLIHIGIFVSYETWRKYPNAMLAATKHIPNSIVHMNGGSKKIKRLTDHLDINLANGHGNKIPHHKMSEVLSSMDLVLYTTFSECLPMLPLESLSVGTPCLLGPCSDLFLSNYPGINESQDYLYDMLVVPHPDDNFMIAEYANHALREKEKIMGNYMAFATEYNQWCNQEIKKFVDLI